ncbi:hypothetical protein GUJ93_ZPchr0013g37290 [Zizania palustris]|uniref:Uncharacterized protein n=1 Tax=Zizania palustris TaxID=103762 RepID=A0A8J6BVE1_ZIZPA|nr:hypothetical protein GUJ93_ZPchr0013g37290 [Zizania palustris]
MGSCVSKKAARAGAVAKVAAPHPLPPEKEVTLPPPPPPPPPVVVVEEEVKEVLSETAVSRPMPAELEKNVVKRRLEQEDEEEASEGASVASTTAEKANVMGRGEQEVERTTVDGMEKGTARRRTPEQRKPKDAGNGRGRSTSPASAQRRQGAGEHPAPPRPRREQPAVVYGIGCRSGRFSPSAARKAAESALRRTNSAREADMMLPHSSRTLAAKRSLHSTVNGNGNVNGGSAIRREPGERSGRRLDSPTSKRLPPPSPAANGAIHRQASLDGRATRKQAAKENTTQLEQTKLQYGGGGRPPGELSDEPALEGTPEHKEAPEGALCQNPSVAMECFIFL